MCVSFCLYYLRYELEHLVWMNTMFAMMQPKFVSKLRARITIITPKVILRGATAWIYKKKRSIVNCVMKRKYCCTQLSDTWSVISRMRVVHVTVAYTALQCKEGKLLYNCQTLKCFQFTNVLAVWRFDSAEDVASFLRYSFYILRNLFVAGLQHLGVKAEPSEPSRPAKISFKCSLVLFDLLYSVTLLTSQLPIRHCTATLGRMHGIPLTQTDNLQLL